MYKAFDLKGFNNNFIKREDQRSLIEHGRKVTSEGKAAIQHRLKAIATGKVVVDGQAIQDSWFPQVRADIFLSHSHRDDDDILMLAGWLHETFGLNCFVDSSIWGYAATLLRQIDNEYCYQEKNNTYSYERRNESTSHVHMMLTTALQMMIHKTECLIFVNTPASIAAQQVVTAQTYSPWIYSELTTAGIVDIVTPQRIEREQRRIEAKSILKEAEQERVTIIHTVHDMRRLIPIDCDVLRTWGTACMAESLSTFAALDRLYEIAAR